MSGWGVGDGGQRDARLVREKGGIRKRKKERREVGGKDWSVEWGTGADRRRRAHDFSPVDSLILNLILNLVSYSLFLFSPFQLPTCLPPATATTTAQTPPLTLSPSPLRILTDVARSLFQTPPQTPRRPRSLPPPPSFRSLLPAVSKDPQHLLSPPRLPLSFRISFNNSNNNRSRPSLRLRLSRSGEALEARLLFSKVST